MRAENQSDSHTPVAAIGFRNVCQCLSLSATAAQQQQPPSRLAGCSAPVGIVKGRISRGRSLSCTVENSRTKSPRLAPPLRHLETRVVRKLPSAVRLVRTLLRFGEQVASQHFGTVSRSGQ